MITDHARNERRAEGEKVGTIFVVKEKEEYCFLFERDNPARLYSVLFECAESNETGLTRQEVMEMIEGMVPDRLRSI
jgi:hypothetical protein